MIFRKILTILTSFLGLFFANAVFAQPVCPVCVVAIGAGLGFSRWLGVDDLISSVWIGAVLLTLVYWTIHFMKGRNWNFKYIAPTVFLLYYVFTFVPLWMFGIIGHPLNVLFGIDKIIFGSLSGTVVLWAGLKFHAWLKIKNGNKSYFPYQRVVVPVLFLALISVIFYLLLIWKII